MSPSTTHSPSVHRLRSALAILAVIALLLPAPTAAVDVTITTNVPKWIITDTFHLCGTAVATLNHWTDDEPASGTVEGLTVRDGSLVLEPDLAFEVLNDGRTVLDVGGPDEWDSALIGPTTFLKHNGRYYCYYHGSRFTEVGQPFHIGLATSDDGLNWTKSPWNPIVRCGVDAFDLECAFSPLVVVEDGNWTMWYSGMNGTSDICRATSVDGVEWTKDPGNPVLRASTVPGAWNADRVVARGVISVGEEWRMYVQGQSGGPDTRKLGLAVSHDGETWAYVSGNPLATIDDLGWASSNPGFSCLEARGGSYRMWVHGSSDRQRVGWLTSDDGLEWVDRGGPVLSPIAGGIFNDHIYNADVIDEGDHYLLYAWGEDIYDQRTIGCFKATPSPLSGTFVSREFDPGGTVELKEVLVGADVPPCGRLDVQVRWARGDRGYSLWSDPGDAEGEMANRFQYRLDLSLAADWGAVAVENVTLFHLARVATVEVSVRGGPWVGTNGTPEEWQAWLDLPDGEYDIEVRATDHAGEMASESVRVRVDRTPPVVSFMRPGRHTTTHEVVEFSVNITDGMDPTPECWWRVAGGEWHELAGRTFNAHLREGRSEVEVRAVDEAGNGVVDAWWMERGVAMDDSPSAWWVAVLVLGFVLLGAVVWVVRGRV